MQFLMDDLALGVFLKFLLIEIHITTAIASIGKQHNRWLLTIQWQFVMLGKSVIGKDLSCPCILKVYDECK